MAADDQIMKAGESPLLVTLDETERDSVKKYAESLITVLNDLQGTL